MASQLGYITIGFIDSEGVPASTNIPVVYNDTATAAVLKTAALNIADAAAALSEDGITEIKFTILASTTPTAPTADSDSQEGLLLNYTVAGTKYPQEIWIPALIDALTVNGKIDLTNVSLLAFTAALVGGTDMNGSNKFAMLITVLRDAAESFRKLKRLATKKSRSRA